MKCISNILDSNNHLKSMSSSGPGSISCLHGCIQFPGRTTDRQLATGKHLVNKHTGLKLSILTLQHDAELIFPIFI